eukprot:jgi/Tetstr1/442459/TSEL_003205.t1
MPSALPSAGDSSRPSTSGKTVDGRSAGNGEKLRVKRFANGDQYHGMWADGKPDGEGVYTWADGSAFKGTWSKGVKHGVGKYTWPSGAEYMGEWKSGYMHGMGTFTAPDKTHYRGSWAYDLKHGLGKKVYANGDTYEGLWKQGKAEGPGHYRWRDGNEYDGEWKGGRMHGKGTFVWKSGERYDGEWQEGQESGIGVFTWADRSLYDGFWQAGRKHGIGIYWPATTRKRASRSGATYTEEDGLERPLHVVPSMKQLDVSVGSSDEEEVQRVEGDGVQRSAVLSASHPSSGNETLQRVAESPISVPSLSHAAEKESPGALPAGAAESGSVLVREYRDGKLVQEVLVSSGVLESMLHVSHSAIKRMEKNKALQRPGETIFKGHESYDLMIGLQQGIRHSIGSVTSSRMPPALTRAAMEQTVKVDFPRSGSNTTPPHPSADFSWKDYAPLTFRKLREMFEIDAGDYMLSLCGDQALREMKTPGKSGSVFYLSHDDKFMVKTMRKEEMKILMDMLPQYYDHVKQYPNTLLTKFYGLHRIKPSKGRQVRFVVMGNLMRSDLQVHRIFDLKGSTVGRVTMGSITPTTVLKDLDLDCTFRLEEGWRDRFVRQMTTDCRFLDLSHVMDYSLLLGIHYRENKEPSGESDRDTASLDAIRESRVNIQAGGAANGGASTSSGNSPMQRGATHRNLTKLAQEHGIEMRWLEGLMQLAERRVVLASQQDREEKASKVLARHPQRSDSMRPVAFAPGSTDDIAAAFHQPAVRLGTNIAATAIPNSPGPGKEPYDVVLLFGIIDVLQEYDYRKRVEHSWKSLQYNGNEISAVNPSDYSERFQSFMKKVFL